MLIILPLLCRVVVHRPVCDAVRRIVVPEGDKSLVFTLREFSGQVIVVTLCPAVKAALLRIDSPSVDQLFLTNCYGDTCVFVIDILLTYGFYSIHLIRVNYLCPYVFLSCCNWSLAYLLPFFFRQLQPINRLRQIIIF